MGSVGIGFRWETDNKKPNPIRFSANSRLCGVAITRWRLSWGDGVLLALVLDGKQTTRNPTQPDSPQMALLLHVGVCLGGMVSVLKLGVVAVFDVVGLVVGFWLGSIGGGFDGGVEVGDWFEIRRRFVGRRMCLGCWCVDIVRC